MKVLAICPSKYPEKYKLMRDSFEITASKHTDICVQPGFGVTEAINYSFESNPDYDFYMILNDDILFETPLWDLSLARKGKISYGSDGIQNENLCTFPMIDGDIVRALGWLQLPTLTKYAGDVVWRTIGKSLDIFNYCPDVKITHQWEESQVDQDLHEKDMAEFAKWLMVSHRDINKIKAVL